MTEYETRLARIGVRSVRVIPEPTKSESERERANLIDLGARRGVVKITKKMHLGPGRPRVFHVKELR